MSKNPLMTGLKVSCISITLLSVSPVSAETMREFSEATDDASKCAAYFAVSSLEYKNSDQNRYSWFLEAIQKAMHTAIIFEAAATSDQDELIIGSPEYVRIKRTVEDRFRKYSKAMITVSRNGSHGMDILHSQYGTKCLDAHEDPTILLRK